MILKYFRWHHAVAVVLLVSAFFLLFHNAFFRNAVLLVIRRDIAPMQRGSRFCDFLFSSFSTIVFSMTFHIDFRFDQKGIENGNENGIEEHSKQENPSLLGDD